MTVTLNGTACGSVTVNASTLGQAVCIAPPGAGVVTMTVGVCNQSVSLAFAYDPPFIASVTPSPLDATAADAGIEVRGDTHTVIPCMHVADAECVCEWCGAPRYMDPTLVCLCTPCRQ